jgi:hypothetical protein
VNTYPRETVEFMPLTVMDGTTPVTTYQVQLTTGTLRPTLGGWIANTALDGKHGVMITGLSRGTYGVWAKVTDNPEIPVIFLGYFSVT